MSKIDIVLQNSHIFLFMISLTIKKIEKNKMFLTNFNVKENLLTNKSFRKKSNFFENKNQIFYNSTTKMNTIVSLWKNLNAFMYDDKLN